MVCKDVFKKIQDLDHKGKKDKLDYIKIQYILFIKICHQEGEKSTPTIGESICSTCDRQRTR